MALKNTVGKGENAGHQHFLLFPQCFLLRDQRKKLSFKQCLFCRLTANALDLVTSKILSLGEALTL